MGDRIQYDIASVSRPSPAKVRNGDCSRVDEFGAGEAVLMVVADGVSTRPSDWKASSTACEALSTFFAKATGSYVERLQVAVSRTHEIVAGLTGDHRGAICTLVAVVWDGLQDCIHFVNVGDSRLHVVSDLCVTCLTEDDSLDTVMFRDGKVVQEAGFVRTSRAITRAIGMAAPLIVDVRTMSLPSGSLLVLTTDGCHGLPGFSPRLIEVFARLDLQKAVEDRLFVNWPVEEQDDATIVGLRSHLVTEELGVKMAAAIANDGDPVQAGIPRHMMVRHAVEQLHRSRDDGDLARFGKTLDYVQRHGLRPGREELVAVLDGFIDDGRAETKRLYDRLVSLAMRA